MPTTSTPNSCPTSNPARPNHPNITASTAASAVGSGLDLSPVGQGLAVIAELLELGQRDAARRECAHLMAGADAEQLTQIAADAQLDRDNAWIPPRPRERYVAPRYLRTRRVGPRSPQHGRGARRGEGDALAAAYLGERGGVDDTPPRPEPPLGYSLDYDLAAVAPLRGTCLNCHLECASADRAHRDGLCEMCRETGHTRASAIAARCSQLTARAERVGENAQELLRAAWRRSSPADRATIAAWVQANQPQILPTPRHADQHAVVLTTSLQHEGTDRP